MPEAVSITVLQPDPRGPLDRFGPWLADAGAKVRLYPLWRDPVPSFDEIGDALIVLGGTASCHDEVTFPWLGEVASLLRRAVASDLPVLGVCLGHQILAEALGGAVQVGHPTGLEEGAVAIEWLPAALDDPIIGPLAARAPSAIVAQSHFDAVVALPPGAVELARSDRYPRQAFRVGSALGVQFHPEASPDLVATWADVDPGELRDEMLAADGEVRATGEAIARGFVAAAVARRAGALHG